MLATLLASAALLGAPAFPETFPVPPGSQPEGIAAGKGTTLYVGSRADGSVYRANARTGRGAVLVPAHAGRGAFGLKRAGNRLYVAGGSTGFAYVYDARTGADVDAVDFDGMFVNDVTVTRRAAYFTDSNKPFIYVYPRGRSARDPYALPITGDFVYGPGFNANGIAATPNGKTLIAVQSSTASLFRIDPETGVADRIELTGGDAANGDGLLLEGHTLYVVQNQLNRVAVIRLAPDLGSGTVERHITHAAFRVPTTIDRVGGRLYLPNARFGVSSPDTAEYEVVSPGKH
jgi:sugar lactone lactonase YvrE